jgi:hypothetical protein
MKTHKTMRLREDNKEMMDELDVLPPFKMEESKSESPTKDRKAAFAKGSRSKTFREKIREDAEAEH